MVRCCSLVLGTLESNEMIIRSILALSAINIGLAMYAGFFIPPEYHTHLAIPVRDYFLISFVGLCVGIMLYYKDKKKG